ncbi:indoleacetamide hydrolase [Pseudomonas akapageensis]|uniref:indoleacetamide hydrolase n=1 Tax=Pseudomonas akapageensis TaxID=2609961 RepID=UPI00140B27A3|nr:indoleacetamide hydrolase [Pseudomonas akapageensis]
MTPSHFDLTISQAQAAFRDGSLSSRMLVQACLDRAESGAQLNAFVTLDAADALTAADAADSARRAGKPLKPLSGIPIVVKDNIHAAGLPSTAGTPALAGFIPREDAPVLQRLREAGAIVLGKTNLHELAFGATGYNPAFNTGSLVGVRNPYDARRIAGGSSSGSAVALGARMALAALGTDTGGSMRIPCALNGCASLRPSAGRYPDRGIAPIAPSRDTAGPMALCMADVALLDGLICDDLSLPPVHLGELRLGIADEFWRELDADTLAASMAALEKLRGAGVSLVRIDDSRLQALNHPIGFPVVIHEAHAAMVAYLREQGPGISIEALVAQIASPDVRAVYEQMVLPGKVATADGLVAAEPLYRAAMQGGKAALQAHYQALFSEDELDGLLFPTSPVIAPFAEAQVSEPGNFERLIQNTEPAASAGLPCIQLPVGLGATSGMPIGLELDGPAGSDRRLLAIGIALEGVLGRIPSASA